MSTSRSNQSMVRATTVKVAVRLRPTNLSKSNNGAAIKSPKSPSKSHKQCVTIESEKKLTISSKTLHSTTHSIMKKEERQFEFDSVLDWTASQARTFQEICAPMLDHMFKGYNSCFFAYGETGSGKTHTIYGKTKPQSPSSSGSGGTNSSSSSSSSNHSRSQITELVSGEEGMIPRSGEYLFRHFNAVKSNVFDKNPDTKGFGLFTLKDNIALTRRQGSQFFLTLSVLELYLRDIKDLSLLYLRKQCPKSGIHKLLLDKHESHCCSSLNNSNHSTNHTLTSSSSSAAAAASSSSGISSVVIRETPNGDTFIDNLCEIPFSNYQEFMDITTAIMSRVQKTETESNSSSSRSHLIFTLSVYHIYIPEGGGGSEEDDHHLGVHNMTDGVINGGSNSSEGSSDEEEVNHPDLIIHRDQSGQEFFGDLLKKKVVLHGRSHFVDLAGKERSSNLTAITLDNGQVFSKYDNQGFEFEESYQKGSKIMEQRMLETSHINSSLSALGRVVSALANENTTHVPFRDTILTRILQSSLNGNCHTTLIAAINPSNKHSEPSLHTLQFAQRCTSVYTRVHTNALTLEEYTIDELKKRVERLVKENGTLKIKVRRSLDYIKEVQHRVLLESQRTGNPTDRSLDGGTGKGSASAGVDGRGGGGSGKGSNANNDPNGALLLADLDTDIEGDNNNDIHSQKKIDELTKENDTLKTNNDNLEKQLKSLQMENEQSNAKLIKENTLLNEQLNQHLKSLNALKQSNKELKKKLNDLRSNSERTEMMNELNDFDAKLKKDKQKPTMIEKLKKQVNEGGSDSGGEGDSKDALQKLEKWFNEQINTKNNIIDELMNEHKKMNKEMTDLKTNNNLEIRHLRNSLFRMNECISRLQHSTFEEIEIIGESHRFKFKSPNHHKKQKKMMIESGNDKMIPMMEDEEEEGSSNGKKMTIDQKKKKPYWQRDRDDLLNSPFGTPKRPLKDAMFLGNRNQNGGRRTQCASTSEPPRKQGKNHDLMKKDEDRTLMNDSIPKETLNLLKRSEHLLMNEDYSKQMNKIRDQKYDIHSRNNDMINNSNHTMVNGNEEDSTFYLEMKSPTKHTFLTPKSVFQSRTVDNMMIDINNNQQRREQEFNFNDEYDSSTTTTMINRDREEDQMERVRLEKRVKQLSKDLKQLRELYNIQQKCLVKEYSPQRRILTVFSSPKRSNKHLTQSVDRNQHKTSKYRSNKMYKGSSMTTEDFREMLWNNNA